MNTSPQSWNKKGIAIYPQAAPQFIDHLSVIATIMDIPCLFLDEEHRQLASRLYPGLQVHYENDNDFSLDNLVKNYDVSFLSDLWPRKDMHAAVAPFEEKYNKKLRNVHCPHGFSDKGFYLCRVAREDVTLIYGDNMIDQIRAHDEWEKMNQYVITGNYRYSYYLEHKEFYRKIFEEDIQSHFDKKRPIILYAPTWTDYEGSCTLFEACSHIVDQLPDDYNIIVKLHPRLEFDDVVNYHATIGRYEDKSNVLFLTNYPLIFPILDHADIYIGDMSSIGYDFLAFDKPLFLLNKHNRDPNTDRGVLLYHCANQIKPSQYPDIYKIIEESLPHDAEKYSQLRKQMWQYTFGNQRPFADIKADIIATLEA